MNIFLSLLSDTKQSSILTWKTRCTWISCLVTLRDHIAVLSRHFLRHVALVEEEPVQDKAKTPRIFQIDIVLWSGCFRYSTVYYWVFWKSNAGIKCLAPVFDFPNTVDVSFAVNATLFDLEPWRHQKGHFSWNSSQSV